MKQLVFTVSLIAGLISFSSFKSVKEPIALRAFYNTFDHAQNVSWTTVDHLLRIGFTEDDHNRFAYYSDEDLVAVATEIKTGELPTALQLQLKEYESYVVTSVYELQKGQAKEYCIVLDNPSKHVVLKGQTKWYVYSKCKK